MAHELGHAIEYMGQNIPTEGIMTELKQLYNTLNTGRERTTNLMLPKHFGYTGDDISREYIAEAIRAYLVNPNYIKTVAPDTAARIRQFVNSNPRVNKIIQFNSGAGDPATAALFAAMSGEPQQTTDQGSMRSKPAMPDYQQPAPLALRSPPPR